MPRILVAACGIGHALVALVCIATLLTVDMDPANVRTAVGVVLACGFTTMCLSIRLEER